MTKRIPKNVKKTRGWTHRLGAQGARMDLRSGRANAPTSFKETARRMGISPDTYYRIRYVNEHGSDEVKAQLKRKEISVNKAYLLTRPEAATRSKLSRGSYKTERKDKKARLTIYTKAQNVALIERALERLGINKVSTKTEEER